MFGRVLLVIVAAAALASAQRGGGGGGRGGRNSGETSDMPTVQPRRQSRIEQFADKLKLDKEQRQQAETILLAAMQQSVQIRQQIDKSRADIAGAMVEGKPADEIKKLTEAHTALEAQMDLIEADAFAKIVATLKPNQQSKAGPAFELMAGVFDRSAGGGRGGQRGGR